MCWEGKSIEGCISLAKTKLIVYFGVQAVCPNMHAFESNRMHVSKLT